MALHRNSFFLFIYSFKVTFSEIVLMPLQFLYVHCLLFGSFRLIQMASLIPSLCVFIQFSLGHGFHYIFFFSFSFFPCSHGHLSICTFSVTGRKREWYPAGFLFETMKFRLVLMKSSFLVYS